MRSLACLNEADEELCRIFSDAAVKCDTVVNVYKENLPRMYKQEQIWKRLVAKGITYISDPIRSTFLERTKSQVTTLQSLRRSQKESKAFFIAGSAHLCNVPIFSGEAYDIRSMYEELCHHKAAILVPKMCNWERSIEDVIAEIELPEGLVLTEQQITDLRKILYSVSSEDIQIMTSAIAEFLTPIISSFFLSK